MMEKLAQAYARAGWFVFPCIANGKLPACEGGVNDATQDPSQISSWWSEGSYNIGLAVGRSNVVVLDIDNKTHNGIEELRKVDHAGEVFDSSGQFKSDNLVVKTPSGGFHIYYRNDGHRNSAGKIAPAVDTRGHGGYVLAPGSVLAAGVYRKLSGRLAPRGLPPAPRLLDYAKAGEKREDAGEWLVEPDLPNNMRRLTTFLKQTDPAVEGEGGDAWTVKTAAMCRDFGASPDKALDLLWEHWNSRCDPPWDYEELAVKVRNAYAYADRPAGSKVTRSEAWQKLVASVKGEVEERHPNPFDPLCGSDVMNLPPPEWLVDSMIMENSLVLLSGAYGSYKSFVALDLAMGVARGSKWLGQFQAQRSGKALYCAGEGVAGLRQRYAAYCKARGGSDDFLLVRRVPVWADLDGLSKFNEVLNRHQPALIIIDTFARSAAGFDENSASDVGEIVALCDAIRGLHWRPTVMLVHHLGKDAELGSRGSVALPAAVDTEIIVSKGGRSGETFHGKLRVKKQKEGEEPSFALEGRLVDFETHGEPGQSLVFEAVQNEEGETKQQHAQRLAAEVNMRLDAELIRRILDEAGHAVEFETMAAAVVDMRQSEGGEAETAKAVKQRWRRWMEAGGQYPTCPIRQLWRSKGTGKDTWRLGAFSLEGAPEDDGLI